MAVLLEFLALKHTHRLIAGFPMRPNRGARLTTAAYYSTAPVVLFPSVPLF